MDEKHIVVLGGSFNPPTIAHQKIMEHAMIAASADTGIFVPSSDAYVTRKMSKAKTDNQVYPENERAAMLIFHTDENTTISMTEYGDDGRGHTYETLCKIQEAYPDARIWFVIGDDKLDIMTRWRNHEALLKKFFFVVLTRNGTDVQKKLRNHPVLRFHVHHFVVCKSPDEINEISSTKCREMINREEWNELEQRGYMNKNVIDYIRRRHGKQK